MSEESDAEKTEAPTPHRLEKARKEGQLPRSKELTSLFMLVSGWGLMGFGGDRLARQLAQLLHNGLSFDSQLMLDPTSMLRQLWLLAGNGIIAALPFMLGLFLVGVMSPMLLGGLYLSGKSLKFDLKKLNPLAGFKRIFSAQLFSELAKGLLKVTLVGSTCAFFVRANWEHLIQLSAGIPSTSMGAATGLILRCFLLIVLSLIPMVGYDVFYQLYSHLKKLRMSRQEIKDEFKEQEGNQQVKGKIRQMQRAAANRRMMSDVPRADVVVNNPTHYSIALRYQEGAMGAPLVVAKGAGEIALRIREKAQEHKIPMLEAPPLARALYKHCELGDPIPAPLYTAVAEVLAWVYGLKRWRSHGGTPPVKPVNLPVPPALDPLQERQR